MDRSEYMSVDADYWYNKGMEDERAKIVARLRDDRSMIGNALRFAHWIEKGEHWK